MQNNPFREEHSVCNGQYKLITEETEARMSHWIKGFGLDDNAANTILPLNTSFHLNNFESEDKTLKVYFNVYPDNRTEYEVIIDPAGATFLYKNTESPLQNFSEFFERLTDEFRKKYNL